MLKKLLLSFLLIGTMLHAMDPAETTTRESATQLYFGTYDRAPDADGLAYWVGTGLSNQVVARSYFDSDETKIKYPDDMTDGDFVDAVYMNVLNRPADEEEKAYWVGELKKDLPRSDFIISLLGTEGGEDEQVINNKTTVGLAFANDGRNDIEEAYAIMLHVTADPRSVTATLCLYDLGECPTFAILVSPTNAFVEVGEQAEFNATAAFEGGIKIDVTKRSEWISSDEDIAKVNNGVATGLSVGSSTIIALFSLNSGGGNTGSVGLDVLATPPTFTSLSISGTDTVMAGLSEQLYSVATLSNGNTYLVNDKVDWTSSDPDIATVDLFGSVTGVDKGEVTITATAKNDSNVVATHTMAVTNDLVSIEVSPDKTYVLVGSDQQFTATAIFSNGAKQDITSSATWNSSDAGIASIDAAGLATGVSEGSVDIDATYSIEGIEKTGTAVLDVLTAPPTFVSLAINGSDSVLTGLTEQLNAIATLSDGSTYIINDKVNWVSNHPAFAIVDTLGSVTGIAMGDVNITATAKNNSSIVAAHEMTVMPNITNAQAKDAMALNALFYPILAPLQSCLSDIPSCIGLNFPSAATVDQAMISADDAQSILTADMGRVGDYECTIGTPENGTYTVSSLSPLVVEFGTDLENPGCIDMANAQDIEGALMSACIEELVELRSSSAQSSTAGTNETGYEVAYEGKVTCTAKTSVVFADYIASAYGQTDPTNKPNRNSYNMTVSIENGLGMDGTYQNEKWAPGGSFTDPKVNDELWTFDNLNLSLDTSSGITVMATGRADYLGTVRLGDEANNGMELFINFDNLTYTLDGNPDADVTIAGGVSASCHPEVITYATTETMRDVGLIRDSDNKRMPSEGSMSMMLPGYDPVSAVFTAPGDTAQVIVASSEGTVAYPNWRAITTTSSCAVLQEIIDRVIVPSKPIDSIEIREGCGSSPDTPLIDADNPLELLAPEEQCINAFANYRDGTKGRVTTTVFWKSSDRSIATMNLLQRNSRVTGVGTGSTTVTATLDGVTGSAPVNVVGVDSIEIQKSYVADGSGEIINTTGNPLDIAVGEEFYITAWGNYSDGEKRYINTEVFWKSDDNDIASMPLLQTSSYVTGESVGSTEVSATLGAIEGRAEVNVTAAP